MKNPLPRSRHLALALVAMTAIACSSRTAATTSAEPGSVRLAVQNSSDFQVNVFAVPSLPSARIRLGTVSPLSSGQLEIPSSALAPGGALKVMVDPVGATTQWTSQTINVSADLRPCLRVMADASGDLSRSTLVSQVGGTAGCM
jgi:hypothetical protein